MRRLLATISISACVLSACPSVETTPAAIVSAAVVGDARSSSFVVHVVGRGFAPSALEYNLASGTGSASSDFVLHLIRSLDGVMYPSARVDLLSTTELDAHVAIALAPGVYDVRLVRKGADSPLAELEGAFSIEVARPGEDAAVFDDASLEAADAVVQNDATIDPDGGVIVEPDGGAIDGGLVFEADATTYPDAEPPEVGPPDVGIEPDSGLGNFAGNYLHRQEVRLTNNSSGTAPIGTTFVLPIPHAAMISAGFAKADGTDLALYFGTTSYPYVWEDAAKLGTDQLVMIAQLPEEVLAQTERDRTTPLVLYYGDPAANVQPTDAVFTFSQRFNAALPNTWTTRVWTPCAWDRSSELPAAANGAYCVTDDNGEQRVTVSSPRLANVDSTIAPNLVYVLSFFLSGVMTGANDLVYFAIDDDTDAYELTQQLSPAAWTVAPPLVSQTFVEINNFGNRTVTGWRFGATRQAWTRSVARFRTPFDDPSLHLRFLSIDNADNAATFVAVDDYTLRLALDVEMTGSLDPVESRN